MNTIEVMKQALEALEKVDGYEVKQGLFKNEIANLRAAIEAESKGCKECDGTGYDYVGEVRVWCPVCNNPNDNAAAEKQEPVATVRNGKVHWHNGWPEYDTKLYTHPTPVPEGWNEDDFTHWFRTVCKDSGVDEAWIWDIFNQWAKYAAAPKPEVK